MKSFLLSGLSFLFVGLSACSQSSTAKNPEQTAPAPIETAQAQSTPSTARTSSGGLTQLFSRVWRVTKAPSSPAPGSIYVFLPNGTLLQTSCGEPYRIATWKIDKSAPSILRVTEDGRQAYTAKITGLTDTTLQLQRSLDRSRENQALTLTAVQQEFVCPDSRR